MIFFDNPTLVLIPVSEVEREKLNRNSEFRNVGVYILYRRSDNDNIQIGMLDESLGAFFESRNLRGADTASFYEFFYESSSLKNTASKILDRPVYEVFPSENRQVLSYNILNDSAVLLEEVLSHKFDIEKCSSTDTGQLVFSKKKKNNFFCFFLYY